MPILAKILDPLKWKAFNPNWYKTPKEFIPSGRIQLFTNKYNSPAKSITPGGQLGEATVGYTQGMRCVRFLGWQKFYRLYYQTLHWITDIIQGPADDRAWYEITDERLRVRYAVPAKYIRLIQSDELTPISFNIPLDEKHLQVAIEDQIVTVFEGDEIVFQTTVSTGVHIDSPTPNSIPKDTPLGRFHIGNKMPSRHIGDKTTSTDCFDYELPGVPWNMFFMSTGVAFHGAN